MIQLLKAIQLTLAEKNQCAFHIWKQANKTKLHIQKDSILEGKVCIEHVISWWRTRSCAEKGAHDRMSMAVIVLSHYNLNNWAFVVVRYDPMICCVLHARVHPAERHQPTLPPSPWLLARKSSKRLALVYTMQNSREHVSRDWHASLSTEFRHAVARAAEQHRNIFLWVRH